MIDQVQAYPPKEVFFRVATEMFSDGTFNWGRVVALFYFACRLVLKVSAVLLPFPTLLPPGTYRATQGSDNWAVCLVLSY